MRFITIIFMFAIMMFTSSFSHAKKKNKFNKGDVIHSFKSGRMQCQSQIDPEGHIAILLTSLTDNTTVEFQSIEQKLLKVFMKVKTDTDICASWVDLEPLTIVIYPKAVKKITLGGKTIYESNNLIILGSGNVK